jgi:hypothetical protein
MNIARNPNHLAYQEGGTWYSTPMSTFPFPDRLVLATVMEALDSQQRIAAKDRSLGYHTTFRSLTRTMSKSSRKPRQQLPELPRNLLLRSGTFLKFYSGIPQL